MDDRKRRMEMCNAMPELPFTCVRCSGEFPNQCLCDSDEEYPEDQYEDIEDSVE